jgi:hypothetical protein
VDLPNLLVFTFQAETQLALRESKERSLGTERDELAAWRAALLATPAARATALSAVLVTAPARRAAACAHALRLWQLAAARLSVAPPSPLLGPGSPTQRGAEQIEIAASPLFAAARRAARRSGTRRGGGAAGAATARPPSEDRIDEADEARIDGDRVLSAGPCSDQVATNRSWCR